MKCVSSRNDEYTIQLATTTPLTLSRAWLTSSWTFTSAPRSMRNFPISTYPRSAASIRGVRPSYGQGIKKNAFSTNDTIACLHLQAKTYVQTRTHTHTHTHACTHIHTHNHTQHIHADTHRNACTHTHTHYSTMFNTLNTICGEQNVPLA